MVKKLKAKKKKKKPPLRRPAVVQMKGRGRHADLVIIDDPADPLIRLWPIDRPDFKRYIQMRIMDKKEADRAVPIFIRNRFWPELKGFKLIMSIGTWVRGSERSRGMYWEDEGEPLVLCLYDSEMRQLLQFLVDRKAPPVSPFIAYYSARLLPDKTMKRGLYFSEDFNQGVWFRTEPEAKLYADT